MSTTSQSKHSRSERLLPVLSRGRLFHATLLVALGLLLAAPARAQYNVVELEGQILLRSDKPIRDSRTLGREYSLETPQDVFGDDAAVMNDVLEVLVERQPHEGFDPFTKFTPDGWSDNSCYAAAENMYQETTGRGVLPPGYDIREVGTLGTLTTSENFIFAPGESFSRFFGEGYNTSEPTSYAHSLNVVKTPNGKYYTVDNWTGGSKVTEVFPIGLDDGFFSTDPNETDVRNATHRLNGISKGGRPWEWSEQDYDDSFDGPLRDYSKEIAKDDPPPTSEPVEVEVLTSADPNDKLGLPGSGTERYIRPDQRMPYLIRFENMPDATAPAQEVLIRDTLDVRVFDLSTFELGDFTFGDQRISVPPGRKAFSTRVPLADNRFEVLITAGLVEATGIVTWKFTTLELATGDLPFDPLDGFLPPNETSPEGEGSVAFTIDLLPNLPSGTEVRNEARIIFDLNEPIDTPLWSNTIDTAPPSSRVTEIVRANSDSLLTVRWGGQDDGSGIRGVDVYLSINDGPFLKWISGSYATESVFVGEDGATYAFFSIARDGTGNIEPFKTAPDITTTIVVSNDKGDGPDLPDRLMLAAPYPNPTPPNSPLNLDIAVPEPGRVTLKVYDVLGREVAMLADADYRAGWHRLQWTPDRLASGTYFVRLQAHGRVVSRGVTVVR